MTRVNKNGLLSRRSVCGSGVSAAALMLAGCGGGGGGSGGSDSSGGNSSGPINGGLTGKMYSAFTSTVNIVDLATGDGTEITRKNGTALNGYSFNYSSRRFDLSADNKTFYFINSDQDDRLAALDIASNTVRTVFKVENRFHWGEIRLSPDGKKFAMVKDTILTSNKPGVYIFDTSGNQITAYPVTKGEVNSIAWTPDNRLLFSDNGIYLTNSGDLENASRISTISASSVSINPDGNKIAYASQGHIWSMGINASNPSQITTGDNAEFRPRWSLDGKHIVFHIALKTTVGGSTVQDSVGSLTILGVIPADGKQYTLNKSGSSSDVVCGVGCATVSSSGVSAGEGVILLKVKKPEVSDKSLFIFSSEDMMWR